MRWRIERKTEDTLIFNKKEQICRAVTYRLQYKTHRFLPWRYLCGWDRAGNKEVKVFNSLLEVVEELHARKRAEAKVISTRVDYLDEKGHFIPKGAKNG